MRTQCLFVIAALATAIAEPSLADEQCEREMPPASPMVEPDVDGDGTVGFSDLLHVLGGFGTPDASWYIASIENTFSAASNTRPPGCELGPVTSLMPIINGESSFSVPNMNATSDVLGTIDTGDVTTIAWDGTSNLNCSLPCYKASVNAVRTILIEVTETVPFTFESTREWESWGEGSYPDISGVRFSGPSVNIVGESSVSGELEPGTYELRSNTNDGIYDPGHNFTFWYVMSSYTLTIDAPLDPADVDVDGDVDMDDLVAVLSNWGG